MCIKMADISNCGRPTNLYLKWGTKIADEFYLQGDREVQFKVDWINPHVFLASVVHFFWHFQVAIGNPVSPLMDRRSPTMAKGQIAFMNYVVWLSWLRMIWWSSPHWTPLFASAPAGNTYVWIHMWIPPWYEAQCWMLWRKQAGHFIQHYCINLSCRNAQSTSLVSSSSVLVRKWWQLVRQVLWWSEVANHGYGLQEAVILLNFLFSRHHCRVFAARYQHSSCSLHIQLPIWRKIQVGRNY